MRLFLLLLGLTFSSAAATDTSGLRLFYCIHSERPCQESAEEISVVLDDALALASKALSTKDDFIGFTDPQQTTLQFYVEDTDAILVDMPVPRLKGSYSTHLNRTQALKLIAGLSSPLSRYRSDLKMKFGKWK